MNGLSLRALLALMLAMGLTLGTGCKSKKAGAGDGTDNIGSLTGDEIWDDPLGSRPGDGTQYQEGLFPPVFFGYDSSQVGATERPVLEQVATYLRQNSGSGVVIEGHCDERGSREYNLTLGERRALSVRDYLINLGVDSTRIQTKSYGEEQPASMGHDDSAWSQNRRAEFVFY